MLIGFTELIYLVILTLVIAYIFMDWVKIPQKKPNLFDLYRRRGFDWNSFKFAALVSAPGIVLHELAHKFTAIYFGLSAAFQIWPFGLGLALVLKIIRSPFLIIAPGYVNIIGNPTASQLPIIAFAGPLVNLVLWIVPWIILKKKKNLKKNYVITLYLTKQINMILFLFNMIPIPPLDGSKVIYPLIQAIF